MDNEISNPQTCPDGKLCKYYHSWMHHFANKNCALVGRPYCELALSTDMKIESKMHFNTYYHPTYNASEQNISTGYMNELSPTKVVIEMPVSKAAHERKCKYINKERFYYDGRWWAGTYCGGDIVDKDAFVCEKCLQTPKGQEFSQLLESQKRVRKWR